MSKHQKYDGPNEGNEPREWVIGNDVAALGGGFLSVPSCPECLEPTYGEPQCPFCAQPLKDPPIRRKLVWEVYYGEIHSEKQGKFIVRGETMEEGRAATKKELERRDAIYLGSALLEDGEGSIGGRGTECRIC